MSQVYILKATVSSGESVIVSAFKKPIPAYREMNRMNRETYIEEDQTIDSVANKIGGAFSVVVVNVR